MATKILIIDDDLNICEAIKLYLEKEFYEIETAHDGAAGVEMCCFDLVKFFFKITLYSFAYI